MSDREAVLAAVEKRLRSIPGVAGLRFLEPEVKEEVRRMERLAEENGACAGLMPFVNKGVWESLDREVSVMIVGNAHLLVGGGENLVLMVDQKGRVIGEYVRPDQRDEILEKDPNASFLSDDFCLHPDVMPEGEPYILIGEVLFPYLENIKGVARVTSGSISTLTDDWIRNVMGYNGSKDWTHLVGFDIDL